MCDSAMKIWNLLVCVWIGVIRGALLDNVELVLTSSPPTATDGESFTLICSPPFGSAGNVAWLQNNASKVITQFSMNCSKQPNSAGNNIDRFSVSCNDTIHSIEFRFNSTTDQGGWQCGKLVNKTYIYPRSNIYNIGVASSTTTRYVGTSSEPVAMTSQKGVASPVTSTQSSPTTTRYMETMSESETVTPQKGVASPVTSTQSSTTTTRYMETTSEPGTVTPHKSVASPVTSTQSSSTTTRYMETTSEPEAMTSQKVVSSSVTSTQSSPTTTRYMETTSEPGTVTPQKGVASPVTSTQSSSTTTRYMETTSKPGTVTPQNVSTDDGDTDTIYIVVGAVGGAVLLVVVVVGIVCIRRRRQAARAVFVLKYQKEDMKGETNVTAFSSSAQVDPNAANCDMVENELYRRSRDIAPTNEAENQERMTSLCQMHTRVWIC
ncbi:cell wall integrity and stress response component 4-like isoform X5 [Haliotis rubra]|uniref:cell wall integrity and stress response component 4-like isoform X5 n=1 Tax=Haliotis rubra TaxID=36100 RepID=UPI001EE54461|nr:cell wall integrity and stress response component 4-like isoform X5 [Haliotis rubra]